MSAGASTTTGRAFEKARAQGRAALVGYLPAGFPDVDGGIAALRAMVDAGCDVIEVGLPYSDPVMDGPTIQDAAQRALEGGVRTADVLRTVEAVAATGTPTLVMTYWNPVERYGVERFAQDLYDAGGAGLITPDLTPDFAPEWIAAADARGLDKVFLVAPSSTDERIAMTTAACRGFVYATAVMGVTGARTTTSDLAGPLVARTRATTTLPVGVGLGVSNGVQAAEVASYADGVIVGSAFVRVLLDNADDRAAGLAAISALTADLAQGVAGGVRA
ncbi:MULTISPECIES: tryptophan synthase subunit alpha [Nocardioides]|uniref:Tryptophan synthase alpha chain n=1 Tax=Nocardioides vastitatis TaxID=2568655 RepID=A0ABW0ZE09_9ACTN|nr:tryptophan synthase subunit alpha [Nocardioides sp.]THI96390.1 tryptophan synthase subunit alpha [Nocardioides sp.]